MVFKCQEDSFLKEFSSKVVSCEKLEFISSLNGKSEKIHGYGVILEDTILFPEGGGQPSDRGFLNNQKVHHVIRHYDKAIHYVEQPINIGEEVKQIIDWKRRLDHMQQHSGQHLITAIIDRLYKFNTVSWYMGEELSYIELDTSSIDQNQINTIEDYCNQLIRDGIKVTVEVYNENTPEDQLEKTRSVRGLPIDHKGDIRVITIENIDSNMCCGTHVSNLCQLQLIKLLHWEKSKRKGQILLFFQVGNRVIERFTKMIERETKITLLLKTNPEQFPEFINKQQQNIKILNKNLQNVLKDIIKYEIDKIKNNPSMKYYFLHKKEAQPDFINNFIRELGSLNIFVFLSIGDDKGPGNITLYGNENAIRDLSDKICDLLNGKGNGHGKRYQAKVNNLNNRFKVEQLIRDYFN